MGEKRVSAFSPFIIFVPEFGRLRLLKAGKTIRLQFEISLLAVYAGEEHIILRGMAWLGRFMPIE